MEKKIWVSLIVLLIAFVMVGESSIPLSNMNGGDDDIITTFEMVEYLKGASLGGKGTCCSDTSCIGGTCQRSCQELGQKCGWGKGYCCSGSSCFGGTCERSCQELGKECGWGKAYCCSDSSCYSGTCERSCQELGKECGWGKGYCCSDSSCFGGTCERTCKELGQECGIFVTGIPFST